MNNWFNVLSFRIFGLIMRLLSIFQVCVEPCFPARWRLSLGGLLCALCGRVLNGMHLRLTARANLTVRNSLCTVSQPNVIAP
jgi:hypothetical protein